MNGGQALLRTLVASGVEVCFMNPGTSEMHFVAALDAEPRIRPVLGLFEGVATGAADGYGRMTGSPAATLLHLGPGLANGLANLHNARRAATPIINIVGDHATYHKAYDAPLESDIESLARPVSGWFRRTASAHELVADAAEAVAAAAGPPGKVATLVLPADVSWLEVPTSTLVDGMPEIVAGAGRRFRVGDSTVAAVAKVIADEASSALLLGGCALDERGLLAASRVAARCGTRLLGETFPARLRRGAGIPAVERIAYFAELAQAQLEGLRHLVLVDAKSPVSPFAYPGRPSDLVPEGCEVHVLAGRSDDAPAALEALADELGAPAATRPASPAPPDPPTGELSAPAVAAALASVLPAEAIVSDEAITAGIYLPGATEGAPPHDWLSLTGNAIGQGLPLSTGAAVACPDRPVIALQADGSSMYTFQALWTQAREGLDVTTLLLDNGSYAILNLELDRVGATGGPRARSMLEIGHPDIDFSALSEAMGVPASRPETAEELTKVLVTALAEPGPHLVHIRLPRGSL